MNNNNDNNNATLESKLQGYEANLRREREEARRQAELAAERLRLVQEELAATQKTVRDMQEKLMTIEQECNQGNGDQLEQLKVKVQDLNKEVQFQHNELLHKRDKVATLKQTTSQASAKRDQALQNLQSRLLHRRNKVANLPKSLPLLSTMAKVDDVYALCREVQNDHDGRLAQHWVSLVQQKTNALKQETRRLELDTARYEQILQGYQYHFGIEKTDHDMITVDTEGIDVMTE